jgi:cysteine desulfurase/selenocysteine lyase
MAANFPADSLARQFPFLAVHPGLLYLDSAATSQLHGSVVDRLLRYYTHENAAVHRSAHTIGTVATELYEGARASIARQLHAETVIFVRGATEAINLVANCWGKIFLKPGDEILVTAMEHHSNFLPWQEVARSHGVLLRTCDVTLDGELSREDFSKKLNSRTRMVALTHVSNVLGTVNPVRELVREAKKFGSHVLVDGAQWMATGAVNLDELGCDFYVFSGHKMFAPMGIGVLCGRRDLMEEMPPYQVGGGMVERVTCTTSTYRPIPEKWEAGTPNVAGAVALECAMKFLETIQWDSYGRHVAKIASHLTEAVEGLPGVRILGNPRLRAGIFSMVCADVHSHDVASALAAKQICVRAGNHCAQPLHSALGVSSTFRASFSVYNSLEDVERFVAALRWAIQAFS